VVGTLFRLYSADYSFLKMNMNITILCKTSNIYSHVRSSVGIATSYGLDGPRIKSRCGRDFSHTSRPALEPTQPPVQWVPGFNGGKKAAGA
jgi:hypothetical protein